MLQIDDIEDHITKLEKMNKELGFVANKDAIRDQCIEQIQLISRRFSKVYEMLEQN